jgi:hypothetical protein
MILVTDYWCEWSCFNFIYIIYLPRGIHEVSSRRVAEHAYIWIASNK